MDTDDLDVASILSIETVLRSYTQHGFDDRPDSPTPSYRTTVPVDSGDGLCDWPASPTPSYRTALTPDETYQPGCPESRHGAHAAQRPAISRLATLRAKADRPEARIERLLHSYETHADHSIIEAIAVVLRDPVRLSLARPSLLSQIYVAAARAGSAELLILLKEVGLASAAAIAMQSSMNLDELLSIAVRAKNLQSVQWLLDNGVSATVLNTPTFEPVEGSYATRPIVCQEPAASGQCNFHHSIFGLFHTIKGRPQDLKLIELLFANGVDPSLLSTHARCSKHQLALLWAAGTHNQLDVRRCLIRAGVDVNKRNSKRESPLHLAVRGDRPVVTRLLLSVGASPNIRDQQRRTPVHLAIDCPDAVILRILAEYEANLCATDENGDTPLHLSIRYYEDLSAVVPWSRDLFSAAFVLLEMKVVAGWVQRENINSETAIDFVVY